MKKIYTIIVILVATIGMTAFLNMGGHEQRVESQENAVIALKLDGEAVAKADLNLIQGLRETEFKANLKSSGKDPIEYTYTGVEMKDLFKASNIDLEGKVQVVVKAVDGYTVVLSLEEVLEEDNVYIVYMIDRKPLGKKEDGGTGPYQIVIRKDKFGQRWAKFVMEIEIQ